MRRYIFPPMIFLALPVGAFAQPAQRFEAVSIRPNNTGVERSTAALLPGGRLDATNKTFQWLLRVTFGVQEFQIVGAPGWVETDHSSLFTALHQQLGLRLESQRGPVEFIVIDRINKPSAN